MKKLLYFSADWCTSCQTLEPNINGLKSQIKIDKINIDYDATSVSLYSVQSVPTVILVENGQELRRFVGSKSQKEIIDFLNG